MSLTAPERMWWKPLGWQEKLWVTIALVWCLALFLMMPLWGVVGKQNNPVETYRVAPADFFRIASTFIEKHTVGNERGVPVVRPPAGGEAYLIARIWQWTPILELKRGETYRLHVSSIDLQHGLSIQPLNMNFQVLPGYDYVLTLTPTQVGEYSLICNEYCLIGHHTMTGKIIVKE